MIREIVIANAWWMAFFFFFALGACFYMTSTALMKGTIFVRFRAYVDHKAEDNRFFHFIKGMLGCLMCTAMETTLWTVGVATFVLGLVFRVSDQIVAGFLQIIGRLGPGQLFVLPLWASVILMLLISVAISFAIAGEAWAIKTVVEHGEQKFLNLRNEFRIREEELEARIVDLSRGSGLGSDSGDLQPLSFRGVIIPYRKFLRIYETLKETRVCQDAWCPYSKTTCYVRAMRDGIKDWWNESHDDPAGFEVYSLILGGAIRTENDLYWTFYCENMASPEAMYAKLKESVRAVIEGEGTDEVRHMGPKIRRALRQRRAFQIA